MDLTFSQVVEMTIVRREEIQKEIDRLNPLHKQAIYCVYSFENSLDDNASDSDIAELEHLQDAASDIECQIEELESESYELRDLIEKFEAAQAAHGSLQNLKEIFYSWG